MNMKTGLWMLAAVALALGALRPTASAQSQSNPFACSAEAVWVNCWEGLGVPPGAGETVMLHLRSHVSEGGCVPARVALTAAYVDSKGDVLCVGTHPDIATVSENVQDLAIEINPRVLRNFARWRNRPNQRMDPMFEPLACAAPDGRSNLLDNHLESAVSVEIAATILPPRGGLSAAECRIRLVR